MAFLSIDVSSEVETLCEAQLRGTWQVPAELVRLALRLGAKAVSVERRRRGFGISWKAPNLDAAALTDLASALDPGRVTSDRQRAIAALEDRGLEALLWAAGLRGSRIRVASSDGRRRSTFEGRHGRRPRLEGIAGPAVSEGVEIEWRCAGLDRRRAVRWLAVAARFSHAAVEIDGRPAPRGFAGGLYYVRLEDPLPCRIGLTRSGDEPVLWLLQNGVVSTRASLPGYPPFEAAVELGGRVAPGASGADLRRAVTPFLVEIVDRAMWMMLEVSGRLSALDEGDRQRLCLILLRSARKGIRNTEISRVPLVKSCGDDRLLSVEEIREMADRRGGLLQVVDSRDADGQALVEPRSTLVASSEVREILCELTSVRFQTPCRRFWSLRRRAAARLGAWGAALWHRTRGLFPRRRVPEADLLPHEGQILASIREAITPLGAQLCEGTGSAVKTSGAILVPRTNPAVQAASRLVADEPAWIYPAILALDTGEEFPEEVRRAWMQAMGFD
jgi:hypothetical protein